MGWFLDQERITQAVAHLLRCEDTDRMQYLKVLKLLYWADRESLREIGRPVTGDTAVAMKMGPVLSEVYNYIKGDELTDHDYWDRHFRKDGYDLILADDPGTSKLSRYDLRMLKDSVDEHAGRDGFGLSELTHEFPEWAHANMRREWDGRGSEPIDLRKTMEAVGSSPERIAQVLQERDEERGYFQFFAGLHDEPERSTR